MKQRQETTRIVVHCSATTPSMDIGAVQIRDWHVNENGWSDIGYNIVIRRNGTIEMGRQEGIQGAHAAGYNQDSFAICLVGGIDDDGKPENNFTSDQFQSLEIYLRGILQWYPRAEIMGHRDLPGVTKACPSFNVKTWWRALQ